MTRLSSPIESMKPHYTVVVVGSGYGGGIAASRLARAGQSVCVLERGKEFQPGEYPNRQLEALRELQVDTPLGHDGSPTGLYDLRVNEGISVFKGCGLGGTSLVNANVALRPEPRVFEDPRWPAAIRGDLDQGLDDGYQRAEQMLQPTPYPDAFPALKKTAALQSSAEHMQAHFYRPPINVTFKDGVNQAGVHQSACALCGDCVSGCNYGAKNTVLMNYLPDARNHGAEIFTEVAVASVERRDDKWLVHYSPLGVGREKFAAPELFVTADLVVLAGGTLGTTEILLRSKQRGLTLSDRVGDRFTGNGDVLGFAYNADCEVDGIGFGHRRPGHQPPVGPCITGIIDMREQAELGKGMVIEEGSIPGAVADLLPGALAAASDLFGRVPRSDRVERAEMAAREGESLLFGPYHGATEHTQVFLVMTHDDDDGKIRLEDDRVRIDWARVGHEEIFRLANERLDQASTAIGGTFVRDPIWSKLTADSLITVHPLGGCVMAEGAEGGVVNHKGQVFAAAVGDAVHPGLYVTDGSVVPRPLGVNPLLTISAISERCCALLARDRGWTIDYTLPSCPPTSAAVAPAVGIEFTESMAGWFSANSGDDYEAAAAAGARAGSGLRFVLTIVSEDLKAMLSDPEHTARMTGTVEAPALSDQPMTVDDGEFNLFVADPDNPDVRRMRYRMRMMAADGKLCYFEGFKLLQDSSPVQVWPQTTTLYITIHDGADATGPVLGRGVLVIAPQDFLRQLTTMRATNAQTLAERLGAELRFGEAFAGVLMKTYGHISAGGDQVEPRLRRPLRAPAPEFHGGRPSLVRYRGGESGVVLLAPEPGASSRVFVHDTVDTTLVEYLCANGFDVWVAESADPGRAVAAVSTLSGSPQVHVIAQGGAAPALLAGGAAGLASVVCLGGDKPTEPGGRVFENSRLDAATRATVLELYGGEPVAAPAPPASAAPGLTVTRIYGSLDPRVDAAAPTGHVLDGYGHADLLVGADAARDVFPLILEHLRTLTGPRSSRVLD